MQVIERYIFRRATRATRITLCGLAGTLWVVQTLREIDLVTTKGQATWVFPVISVPAHAQPGPAVGGKP